MAQPLAGSLVQRLQVDAHEVVDSMPPRLTAAGAFRRDRALALYGANRGERTPLVLVELPPQRESNGRRVLVVLDPGGDASGNYDPAPYTEDTAITYARLAAESGATLVAPAGGPQTYQEEQAITPQELGEAIAAIAPACEADLVERHCLRRASTCGGVHCLRSSTGSSSASSAFLTTSPSSVSPSMDMRRLKTSGSGSSWRGARRKTSWARARSVR